MTKTRYCYVIALSFLVFFLAISFPSGNWDMIPYVAAAYEGQGYFDESLRFQTYRDVEEFVTSEKFTSLLTGHYRETVHQDFSALKQQLPFYRIRFFYILFVGAVGKLVGSISFATILVSAISGSLVVALAGLMTIRLNSSLAFYLTPFLVALLGAQELARLSTPDAMASCFAAYTFFVVWKKRILVPLIVIAILPLVRTDFIILSFALAVYFWQRGKSAAIVAFAFSILTYFQVNSYAENYGYKVLFNFTLINGPHPYPLDMQISRDISDYVLAYTKGLQKLISSHTFILGVPAVVIAWRHRANVTLLALNKIFLISLFFVCAHFLLFPAAFSRTYFLFLWSAVVLLAHIYESRQSTRNAHTALPETS